MRFPLDAFSRRRRSRNGKYTGPRRFAFERLEQRATPASSLGFAFALGGTAFDSTSSVAADSAGNVYVAGAFNGTIDLDPGPGVASLTSTGSADAYLAKYSPSGTFLWGGQLVDCGPYNGYKLGLTVGSGGDVYLTGRFSGTVDFDLGAGTSTLTSGSSSSAFVAKYTSGGTLTWARQLGGGTSSLLGATIAVDSSGNVYTAGVMSNGSADLDPGAGVYTLTNTTGNANTFISKLNASGNFVWAGMFANQPPNAAGVWPAAIAVDASQDVYITGIYVGTVDFDPGAGTAWKTTADVGTPYGDGYVVKLDSTGSLSYFVSMGSSSGRDDGNGIAVDDVGNAYITGDFSGVMSIKTPAGGVAGSLTSAGSYDAYVLKLDPSGTLGWASRFGSNSIDEGTWIAFNGSSSIYVTGIYSGSVDFDPGAGVTSLSSVGGYDVFTLRLGIDGSFGWVAGTGGSQYDLSNQVAVDGSGNVITVGQFASTSDFDPGAGTFNLTSAGDFDGFVWKLSQAPTAANDSYSVNEDTPLSISAPGVLSNDSGGGSLSAVLVTGVSHGSLTLNSDGSFTYTPNPNYNGPDSFTYRANDGTTDSNIATVSITINPVNDPPVASDQSKTTDEDIAFNGVLTATDVDSGSLTFSIVANPAHGTLTSFNASNGAYTYRPGPNYNGSDTFTFRAYDGSLYSNVATVSITINPVNDAPFGYPTNQSASTNEDTPVTGVVTGRDVDNDPITFSGDVPTGGGPMHGSVVILPDGSYTYTPSTNFNGTDQFVFKVVDDKGAFGYGLVTVRVYPVNDAPVAHDDSYVVGQNGVLSVSSSLLNRLRMVSEPGDFIGQGSPSGTQPLVLDYTNPVSSFTAVVNSSNGVEIRVADPSVTGGWTLDFAAPDKAQLTTGVYTGAMRWPFQTAGIPGLDVSGNGRGLNQLSGQFTVYDIAYGSSGTITRFAATFVQQGQNFDNTLDPPLSGAIVFNSTFGAAGGLLANDTDPDGDILLTTSLVSGPSHGALTLNADGTFTYTPTPNYFGTDSFTYRTSDGQAQSNVATVNISVQSNVAQFVRQDTATRGDWKGMYGLDGYQFIGDSSANGSNLPSYVSSVSITGATPYIWEASSSNPSALLKSASGTSDRVAAVWYGDSMSMNIHFNDQATHRIALYALDYNQNRSESVSIVDNATGTTIDTRSVSNMASGKYLVWDVTGDVTIVVSNTGPTNAVVSGLFFGQAAPATATFLTTNTTAGGDWKGLYGVDGYQFVGDSSALGAALPSYVSSLTISGATPYLWDNSTSNPAALLKSNVGASDRVAATWYGDVMSFDVHLSDHATHRIALYALDYNANRSEMVTLIDNATGVTLDTQSLSGMYNGKWLVWDVSGSVTIVVTNTGPTNAVVSGLFFGGGASSTAGAVNSTVSGNWKNVYGGDGYEFVGDVSSSGANLPGYVASLTVAGASTYVWESSSSSPAALQKSPANSTDRVAAVWVGTEMTFDIRFNDSGVHRIALYALDYNHNRSESISIIDASSGATLTTQSLSNMSNGKWLVWDVTGSVIIKVTNTGPTNAVVSGLFFGKPSSADFVTTDTITLGAWKGVYGADGYQFVGDVSSSGGNLPGYVSSLGVTGSSTYIWESSSTNPSALTKSPNGSTDGVAAVWDGDTMTFDIHFDDNAKHRVAIYLLDYNANRAESISVVDDGSGAVLDTQAVSGMSNGKWLVWDVTGSVSIVVTNTGPTNAVLSGLFFGPAN